MIEENLNCLGHLSTIIHEANEEQGSKMMVSFIWIWVCFDFPCKATSGIWDAYGEKENSEEREKTFKLYL